MAEFRQPLRQRVFDRSRSLSKEHESNLGSEIVNLDWDQEFDAQSFGNFYVNWNPSMNKYRAKLHFRVNPWSRQVADFTDSWSFNNYAKTQLMVTLSPHERKNECKFIFELHRRHRNEARFQVHVRLFGFNRTRMRVDTECYKEMLVAPDECFDIFSDIMVFEECDEYDTYIMVVSVLPEQLLSESGKFVRDHDDHPETVQNTQLEKDMLMSLSCYCWFETQIVCIPFRELSQRTSLHFRQLQNLLFKFVVRQTGEFEFRIEGQVDKKYRIVLTNIITNLTHMPGRKTKAFTEDFLSQNQSMQHRANILVVYLEEGEYFVHVLESTGKRAKTVQETCSYKMDFLGFNGNYLDDLESSRKRLSMSEEKSASHLGIFSKTQHIDKACFEVLPIVQSRLPNAREMTGKWHPSTNRDQLVSELQIPFQAHLNSGFVFLLERDSQLSFTVSPEKLDMNECIYSFSLFEIADDFRLNLINGPKQVSRKEFTSDVFYLCKNQNGYLVLAVPKFQKFESTFKMTFSSDQPLGQIRPSHEGVCSFTWMKNFSGELKQYQGGMPNSSSFFLNRGYVIFISEEANIPNQQIFVELSVKGGERSEKLCLYFLPLKMPLKLCKIQTADFSKAKFSKSFAQNYNYYYSWIKPGYYLVVPTTKEPLGNFHKFEYSLKVYCTSQFVLSRNHEFDFNGVKRHEIREKKLAKFRLKVEENTQIMLVVEGAQTSANSNQKIKVAIGRIRIQTDL